MRVLLTLLVLAPALAGCATSVPDSPEAVSGPAEDPFAGFLLDGQEPTVVDVNATTVYFRWASTAPVVAPGTAPITHSVDLTVPAGPTLVITTAVTWGARDADLDLVVRRDDGFVMCRSADGPARFAEPEESCIASPREGRDAGTWTIEVVAFENLEEDLPFAVDVRVAVPKHPAIDPEAGARFDAPVLIGDTGDSEASLFIAPDGTMLACSHGAFDGPSPLWASHDAGDTWTEITVAPNPLPSGDCDVAITSDGTWYMLYNTIASATVASSTDQGRTWQVQPVTGHPLTGAVDRPWFLPDGDAIVMTYSNAAAAAPAAHYFARSTDRGLTWPEHRVMGHAEGPDRVQKIGGEPINWDGGRIIVAPAMARAEAAFVPVAESTVVLHRSDNGGLTWATHEVAGPFPAPLGFAHVARTSDGTLYVSYGRGSIGNTTIEVVWSTDDGTTWSDPVIVADHVASRSVFSAFIDPRPDGSATLAWLQVSGGPDRVAGNQVWVARVDAQADEPVVFVGGITEPYDSNFVYEFIMVRHDADGRAHVVYVEEPGDCPDDPRACRQVQRVLLAREVVGVTGA